MGALTAKPQAFQGRPWEYDETFALDLYDVFGTNIIINTRGTALIRILPRIHKNLNKFLITDKIRFSFDALMLQRILKPMLTIYNSKTKQKQLIISSLRDIYPIMITMLTTASALFVLPGMFINTRVNLYVYNLVAGIYNTNIVTYINELNTKSSSYVWSNYLYPESMESFKQYNTIFIINANVRIQMPILYYYLQQTVLDNFNIRIFSYNSKNLLNNNTAITLNELYKLVSGTSQLLHHIKAPVLFILGKDDINLSKTIIAIISRLQQFGIICNMINTWLNTTQITNQILQQKTPAVIMPYTLTTKNVNNSATLLVINGNNYKLHTHINSIYLGAHPNKNMMQYNIILPIKHYFEETGHYFNFQGVLQTSNRAIDNSEFFFTFYDILYLMNQQIYLTYSKTIYKKINNYENKK